MPMVRPSILLMSTDGLAKGTYTVKMKFYGNDAYLESNQVVTAITVNKLLTTLTTANVNVNYGTNSYVVATLKDGNGKAVSGVKVAFTNNGVKYIVTDANGQAKYSLSGLAAGSYAVKIKFNGDDNYQESNQAISQVTINKVATTLTSSDVNIDYGEDGYLVATLKDAYGNPIKGVKVGFANNGVKYIVTDANGQAKYSLSGLAAGNYTVKMKFYGTDSYLESNQAIAKVVVSQKTVSDYENGYFLFGADMKNVDLKSLADLGTTNIFLNYYAFEKHGESAVVDWIASANKLGMKVHIWMQAFYEGSWVNPIVNGEYNQKYANEKIAEAKYYAGVKGVSGILLDYLRYPGTAYKTEGGTDAISKFTKSLTDEVHKINKNLIVSGALMPETTSNIYYYGQDYSALSSCLDVVMPMIYKGNYGKSTEWIKTTAKWYVDNSKGAKVWAVLQSYRSDDDVSKLPVSELTTDIKNALAGGSDGVILFRYGLSNLVDFNKISGSSSSSSSNDSSSSSSTKPTSISIKDILAGAETLKNYYSKNNKFPTTVTAAGYAFTMPEFLYLMAQAIYQLANSNNDAIECIYGVKAPSSPSGDAIDTNLYRNDYVTVAKNTANFIKKNKVAPNYASSAVGKIMYSVLLDASSRILTFYKNNDNYMPNYVAIKTNGGSSSSSNSSSSSSSKPTSISINDILTGATNLKNYYSSNGVMPKTVTAAGYAFTLPEFLYLMSQAAYQLGNSNKSAIKCIYGIEEAANPTGDTINAQLLRDDYLTVAKNLANYIKTNNQAPNYASSAVGKISYNVLPDAFSRILAFYKANDEYMPNYVSIVQGSGSSSSYTTGGMNVKNTITNLDPYYKATSNCQVNNSAIKSIVNSLTAGLTTDLEKATVLFNYVRDQVAYSYYYDTQKGALGTLNAKSGNCVDQAHLLIAMYRTAGLAARYEHGTCYFPLSGNTYGHVWTQVLIDDVWVVGDPTSNRNSFGQVVSWNTNSYTHKAYYASLPF